MTPSKGDPGGKRRFSFIGPDLIPRLLSAAVLVPLTAAALALGGIYFALLVGAVLAGAFREWENMITGTRRPFPSILLMGFIALTALAYPMSGPWASFAIIGVAVLLAAVASAPARRWRIAGLIVFGAATVAFLSIRGSSAAGIWAGLFLAVVVWSTDSGAYFVGRFFGGTKLSPDVSPSKTWSGAAGGLFMGTLGGLIVWVGAGYAMGTPAPLVIGGLISVVVSISGQAGDLAESALKRRFSIKDSGDIIPGHGGLMDRIDSLTVAGLVLWLIGLAHRGLGAVPQGILLWAPN